MAQIISIEYNKSDELIINTINLAKLKVYTKKFETLNMSLDSFSNWLIWSLFVSRILFGETEPQIISNGFRYDGLSFL
jgi:hypothetical protein